MPTKKSDALKLLVQHHKEIKSLLEALLGGGAEPATLRQLAQALSLHLTVKERALYPYIILEDLDWRVQDALKNHLHARRGLAALICLDLESPQFETHLRVLRDRLEVQFQEEAFDLFPQVRAALNRPRLSEIATGMKALAKQLSSIEPPAPPDAARPGTRRRRVPHPRAKASGVTRPAGTAGARKRKGAG